MKKRMYDDQKKMLKSCLDYIEQSIGQGKSYSQISKGLEMQFHSNYGTLRNLFSTYAPFPLSKYIKRRIYTEAYLKYKKNRIYVSTRDEYEGINQFKTKFTKEFNVDITDDYSADDLQPKLDIDAIHRQ